MRQLATLVVDDSDSFRSEFVEYLRGVDGIHVIGEARDGKEALSMTDALEPELVLLDLSMPNLGGFETIRLIKDRHPNIRVVIVTMHEESSYHQFAEFYHADGFVCKSSIGRSIRRVVERLAN
jgi:DNA-binding NarL/FixJ family response regulator